MRIDSRSGRAFGSLERLIPWCYGRPEFATVWSAVEACSSCHAAIPDALDPWSVAGAVPPAGPRPRMFPILWSAVRAFRPATAAIRSCSRSLDRGESLFALRPPRSRMLSISWSAARACSSCRGRGRECSRSLERGESLPICYGRDRECLDPPSAARGCSPFPQPPQILFSLCCEIWFSS